MDAPVNLDYFIAMDRQAVRIQLTLGAVLVLFGAAVSVAGFAGMAGVGGPTVETVTKLGGFVMGLVGLFPFNTCWTRWERIKTLQAIKLDPSLVSPEALREMVAKLYSKFLGI